MKPNLRITIRDAEPADHASFLRLFPELAVDDPPFSQERFNDEMVQTTLIAVGSVGSVGAVGASGSGCSKNEVLGYAFFRPMTDTVHLSHLVSAPEARRMGVGRTLINEVARRSKAMGINRLKLNVKPHNEAAIKLYESFGLKKEFESRAFKMDWARIDALTEHRDAPYVADVRDVDPADDERIEQKLNVLRGMLADARKKGRGRTLRMIEREPGRIALALYDPGFPGVYPLRAPDREHAFSLFRAIRKNDAPNEPMVHVMVEDQPTISDAFLKAGATLKVHTLTMFGSI